MSIENNLSSPNRFFVKWIPILVFPFFLYWLISRELENDRYTHQYTGEMGILSSDAGGYYAYLPGAFIYNFREIPNDVVADKNGFHYANGKLISKYPAGLAIGESPFFFVADILADKKDGYSRPYHIAIRISGAVYGWLGLLFSFLFLRRRIRWWLALLICALMFWGTNLQYYILREPGYSHVFSFFLITLFFYLLDTFQLKGKWKGFLLFPVFALIVAVRPTDAIILIPALFWKGFSRQMITESWAIVREKRYLFFGSFLIGVCFFIPQLLYNHYILGQATGQLYPGESFSNWYMPRFDWVLFGVSSGLFIHTPVFIFFSAAVVYCAIKKMWPGKLMALFLFIALYIYASWQEPTLGCSFGYRAHLNFLLLWIFPFALLVDYLVSLRQWIVFSGLGVLIIVCTLYTNLLTKFWWFCSYGSSYTDYHWFIYEVKGYWHKQFG